MIILHPFKFYTVIQNKTKDQILQEKGSQNEIVEVSSQILPKQPQHAVRTSTAPRHSAPPLRGKK